MKEEIPGLGSPIDVQYLMHEAYRSVSVKVEKIALDLQDGGDDGPFRKAFGLWGKHLLYHAVTEDAYMTGPLTNSQPARDNEAEHAALGALATELGAFLRKGDEGGLEESLRAILAFEAQEHEELVRRLNDVKEVLTRQVGKEALTVRTRRHLYSRVVALRVAEFDHFENEEAFVLPVIRDRMSEKQQLDVTKRLLIDDQASDRRWIIELVARELSAGKRRLLADLESRWAVATPTQP